MLVGWAVCSNSPESNGRGEDSEGVDANGVHFPSTVKEIYVIQSLNIETKTLYTDHTKQHFSSLTWCARDPP